MRPSFQATAAYLGNWRNRVYMSVEHLRNGDLVPKPPEPMAEGGDYCGLGGSVRQARG